MDLNKALENLKFDQRMRDFFLKHGMVTTDELQKSQQALKDSSSDCEPVTLEDKEDFGD